MPDQTRELMKAVDAYYREHNTLEGCPYLSPEEIEIITYGAEPSPFKDVQPSSGEEPHTGRLLVDMDGTLAKFQVVDTLETLYEEGYYLNLEPMEHVVEAVREIKNNHPEIEVYIMSAVLSDSKFALAEKNQWLDKYLPEIDMEHRLFPPCGKNKLDYVPDGARETDFLLDDYTHNLTLWEPPAKGIKLLNGINHTHETWTGNCLRHDQPPQELAEKIVDIVGKGAVIREERPLHQQAALANRSYEETSGYLTKEDRSGLCFLTEAQALKALESGIHICAVNTFPEYHGIHKDDYFTRELMTSRAVEKLYHGFESGIHHKACISPGYDNIQGLYEAVRQECLRDRAAADIKPKPAEQAVRGPRL